MIYFTKLNGIVKDYRIDMSSGFLVEYYSNSNLAWVPSNMVEIDGEMFHDLIRVCKFIPREATLVYGPDSNGLLYPAKVNNRGDILVYSPYFESWEEVLENGMRWVSLNSQEIDTRSVSLLGVRDICSIS
ncbi:hypothetical protein PQC39_gp078 [Vibrio phage Vp_R1]|uniref:Uncharacterized protein n=1 Tax=Vibrio phage Vp_R1 TaxID=2059867 RepID=A0A2H5BQ74_9CAUD|nr:hypothetical protein PQC39_gp078 [Vibrio phage Vp_R1]AUG88442.1 hypothetical protein VPR_078 [Vibrio phage Vp_R1]